MKSLKFIPLLAGVSMLCACGGGANRFEESSSSADSASTVVNHRSADTLSKAKLVKTADIVFKVKDVQQTSEEIADLTTQLNGTVIHHKINSEPEYSTDIKKSNDSLLRVTVINSTAEMTVRIPPQNLENFMIKVSKMGVYIKSSHMEVSDKSIEYLTTRLKLKNQQESVDSQKQKATKSTDELLTFKNSMVDQQMNNRRTDDSVKSSTVTLSFFANKMVNRETVANDDLSAYNEPLIKRIGMALENGWDVFVMIVIGLANAWVLILVGFGIWWLVRFLKKKQHLAKS